MKHFTFLLILKLALTGIAASAQQCPVIPAPLNGKHLPGTLLLKQGDAISYNDEQLASQALYLQQEIFKHTGLALIIAKAGQPAIISLNKNNKQGNAEGYNLDVKSGHVTVTAATNTGVFRGMTSLLQLIRTAPVKNNVIVLENWEIKDEPRFAWRGLLLDESRHFWGMETVKELLDWMAFYKLNKFHWHLTDEPAWRLEIRKYPRLTLAGGTGTFDDPSAPAQYYTQEQIKEIVAYAAARFIEVIPEVDMPGHATAANKAYPDFSGGGSAQHPDFTFDPGKGATYQYLGNILRETDLLFPSQMIHLGGDEVSFGNEKWKSNTGISTLMQREHLSDLLAVEHYFTARMADSVFKLNNQVLLWDEAADGNLPRNQTIIFWWRHDHPEQLQKALDKGYRTVLCPRLPFYFDFIQDSTQALGRKWKRAFVPTDKLYNFKLSDLPVRREQEKQVLGVQAGLWTEYITTKEKLQYMLFPRITALAEVGWTDHARKNIDDYHQRLQLQLQLYKKDGIYYYNPFHPTQTPEPLTAKQIATHSGQQK